MCSKSIYFKKMFWFPPHASLPWIGFLRGLAFRPWNALYEGLMKRRASQSAQVASGNWVEAMLSGACKMEDQRLTDQRLVTSGMRVRRIQHTSRRARPELSDCAWSDCACRPCCLTHGSSLFFALCWRFHRICFTMGIWILSVLSIFFGSFAYMMLSRCISARNTRSKRNQEIS